MLDRVIALSIRGRGVVLFATLLLIALGLRAALTLPVDAVPDLTNTQVQVLTDATALGSIDVERLVTAPIERVMAGLPLLTEVRSLSRAGASAVTLVFEEGTDPMLARSLVSERMPLARQSVRAGYGVPELGPMSTGLGEIYHFEVRDPERSAMELRTILDWQVIPRLRLVPGVAEVNVFGGEMQTYEVAPDPQRMAALDVSLEDVVEGRCSAAPRGWWCAPRGSWDRSPTCGASWCARTRAPRCSWTTSPRCASHRCRGGALRRATRGERSWPAWR